LFYVPVATYFHSREKEFEMPDALSTQNAPRGDLATLKRRIDSLFEFLGSESVSAAIEEFEVNPSNSDLEQLLVKHGVKAPPQFTVRATAATKCFGWGCTDRHHCILHWSTEDGWGWGGCP
jgi:hypothetical protein